MQLAGGVFGPPRVRDEAVAELRAAADLGVADIDTAQHYCPGVVNELTQDALFPYPRSDDGRASRTTILAEFRTAAG